MGRDVGTDEERSLYYKFKNKRHKALTKGNVLEKLRRSCREQNKEKYLFADLGIKIKRKNFMRP